MVFKDPTLFNQRIDMTFPVIRGLLDKNQEKIIYLNIFDSQSLPDKIAWQWYKMYVFYLFITTKT